MIEPDHGCQSVDGLATAVRVGGDGKIAVNGAGGGRERGRVYSSTGASPPGAAGSDAPARLSG
jgi:hypothetical protein